jgi:hypothetical protein
MGRMVGLTELAETGLPGWGGRLELRNPCASHVFEMS